MTRTIPPDTPSRCRTRCIATVTCAAIILLGGACNRYAADPAAAISAPNAPDDAGLLAADAAHDHPPGAMGGIITSFGGDAHHAEAIIQSGPVLTLYTLGHDPTTIQQVPQQQLTAYVKPQATVTSAVMLLSPAPQPGDSPGNTSRFSGPLPERLLGQTLYVTVPGLRIADQRFAVRFVLPAPSAPAMPPGLADRQADDLYLTAAGRYTEADIEANGRTTAARKYAGFRASHDFNPAPGDAICPITRTKANPQCSWIIGGQTYRFCCPPCIDEFVAVAKSDPDAVLAADAYVQQP